MKSTIRIGDKFTTKEGCVVEVVEYNNQNDIIVKFDDLYKKRVSACSLRRGSIKNFYNPTVCGIGYIGEGIYRVSIGGNHTKAYGVWKAMVRRCYERKPRPAYVGCSVCDEWHNFQNFAQWFSEQPNAGRKGFQLDKDLLVWGNKVYGPDTCSFVPNEINKLLTDSGSARGEWPQGVNYHNQRKKYRATLNKGSGKIQYLGLYETPEEAFVVYKREKEKFVKEQAEKYKYLLHPNVYANLKSWSLFSE